MGLLNVCYDVPCHTFDRFQQDAEGETKHFNIRAAVGSIAGDVDDAIKFIELMAQARGDVSLSLSRSLRSLYSELSTYTSIYLYQSIFQSIYY